MSSKISKQSKREKSKKTKSKKPKIGNENIPYNNKTKISSYVTS